MRIAACGRGKDDALIWSTENKFNEDFLHTRVPILSVFAKEDNLKGLYLYSYGNVTICFSTSERRQERHTSTWFYYKDHLKPWFVLLATQLKLHVCIGGEYITTIQPY